MLIVRREDVPPQAVVAPTAQSRREIVAGVGVGSDALHDLV